MRHINCDEQRLHCYYIISMFYHKDNLGNWQSGQEIHLPDGSILSVKNRENKQGWEWHDEPPEEYLEWLEKQQEL